MNAGLYKDHVTMRKFTKDLSSHLRPSDLAKIILQGSVKGEKIRDSENKRREDNI